jgi:putative hydrolase of HD superfamily
MPQHDIVNYLFEVGILAKTPRSGFAFLGSGEQSVAEHVHRVIHIGYALAQLTDGADCGKVLQMCLFHDLAEARTSDLNYVHQKYTRRDESSAIRDVTATLPFGPAIAAVIEEFEERKSLEARLSRDADQLELILSLKEQLDIGNRRAATWLPNAIKRLQTEPARQLARQIMETDSDEWWYGDKEDSWWVTAKREK